MFKVIFHSNGCKHVKVLASYMAFIMCACVQTAGELFTYTRDTV